MTNEITTKNEMANILASLSVNYRNFGEQTDKTKLVNLWHAILGCFPKILIQNAVLEWIATSSYPPTVHDIKQTIYNQNTLTGYNFEELWSIVLNGFKKAKITPLGYDYIDSYDTFPKILKKHISYSKYSRMASLNDWQMEKEKELLRKQINDEMEENKKKFMLSSTPLLLIPNWENKIQLNQILIERGKINAK